MNFFQNWAALPRGATGLSVVCGFCISWSYSLTILGVRQGDTLSPDLFKIFINDLVEIFGDECDAVSLGDLKLNCLMYTDDVIIVSQSEQGLQKCLNKLETYCEHWYLDININQTKSLVFNKSGKLLFLILY